ncbi:uncharacterized protein LOC116162223 [Photinus pyralis]|nr:uncharacterized protein LOC116162223 [Photinus pyralis]
MAKLAIVFVALFALQGVRSGLETSYLEKTPENISRLIEADTREFVRHLESHGYDAKVESAIGRYVQGVETVMPKLHLKASIGDEKVEMTLQELADKLRKILQVLQHPKAAIGGDFSERLVKVAEIYDSLAEYAGVQGGKLYDFLHTVLAEYCFVVKEAVRMLTMQSTGLKVQTESNLREILDNLKHVEFDNAFVKNAIKNVIQDYVSELKTNIPEDVLSHFEAFFKRGEAMNGVECRKVLSNAFGNLLTAMKQHHIDQNALSHFLASTSVVEFNIYTMGTTNVPHGETTTSFALQIRTISNGLTNTLKALSFENKHAKQILVDQTHEFIVNLKSIVQKLGEVKLGAIRGVTAELNEVIAELEHIVDSVRDMDEEEIKSGLTRCVHKSVAQFEKLLRIERENQGPLKTPTYEIYNDFLATLQHQLIQYQNIYQSTTGKQSIDHMGQQIQTITNSVLVYLRNVPTNDVMIREKLEVQVHHLINRVQAILTRIKNIEDPRFAKIASKISEITESFEAFMEKTKIAAIREVVFHFNILVQKIATEMKGFASLGHEAKLEEVVRSVLGEYLIIIENIQVKIQRINQVAQVGQSPRELALQIEVVAEHLREMLVVFVSDNPLARRTFAWEIRQFARVLDTIAEQLISKEVSESGRVYKDVGSSLKRIGAELKGSGGEVREHRTEVANKIVKAAEEVQRLCWISQADVQEGLGVQSTYVRSILLELLLSLQNFHIQMMHNFQVVASGQSPMKILNEIEQIPKSLFGQLQAVKSEGDLEQILTIQLGEYLQAIENTLNSIHHKMKSNGEHNVEIEKIADVFGKTSLLLQSVDVKDVKEFWAKFEMSLNEFIQGMHRLVAISAEQVRETHVGTHTGILHGVLSNMLTTLRNMYIQLHYTHHETDGASKINELSDRVAMITNNIMPSLETIVGSTTPIKQALGVQIYKFARKLKTLIHKVDKEFAHENHQEIKEIQTALKLSLAVLEQTASSMTTLTINDLKLHFNKLIQGIGADLQKLVLVQTTNKDAVRRVLIHYLRTLKNVHIQIQNISRMSQQSENYQLVAMQIDTAIIELCKFLQTIPSDHKLLAKVIVVESHEMAQLILNIINRYQAAAVVQDNDLFTEIASELKKVQLDLQEMTEQKVMDDLNGNVLKLASSMERSAILIEQLMWVPAKTVRGAQYRPDMPTFVRVTLHDFLSGVQNMFVQIANVIVHVDDKSFGEILNGQTHKTASTIKMPETDELYRPEWELYKGMDNKPTSWYPTRSDSYRQMTNKPWYRPTNKDSFGQRSWETPEPKRVVEEIAKLTRKITDVLERKPIAKLTIVSQIRQLANVLDEISREIRVDQVADNIRNLKLAFDNVLKRAPRMDLEQLKSEVCENLETVLRQFEDLANARRSSVDNLLERYNRGLQMVWRQLQTYPVNGRY